MTARRDQKRELGFDHKIIAKFFQPQWVNSLPGSGKPGRHTGYRCIECYSKPQVTGYTGGCMFLEDGKDMALWRNIVSPKHYEDLRMLYKHLVDVHQVSFCEHCGANITPKGMKNHIKSDACTSDRREHRMTQLGYARLDSTRLEDVLKSRRAELEQYAEWDDIETLGEINRAYYSVRSQLFKDLGVVEVLTDRARSYTGPVSNPRRVKSKGLVWAKASWAPEDVSTILVLLAKKDNETFLREICHYAEADDIHKEAMIGGMDLAVIDPNS